MAVRCFGVSRVLCVVYRLCCVACALCSSLAVLAMVRTYVVLYVLLRDFLLLR